MAKLLFKAHGVLLYDNGDMYKQIEPNDIIKKGGKPEICSCGQKLKW
jgi:hypothetical protein